MPTRTPSNEQEDVGIGYLSQQGNTDALVATHDFHDLISVRIAIIENRGRSFVVREPLHATPQDWITLLDLRAQGFDIKIAMQG
jgi:hypothetical protein